MHAQSVTVKTDRNGLLIGERLQYDLFLNINASASQINLKLPDTIPHFEIIENSNFDTINSNGSFGIHKKIIFTSFDSGAWHIPSFEITLQQNKITGKLYTDSILVNVVYSPADSTNQLRDIKPVMEVTVKDYFWYYFAAVSVLAIIIIVLIYLYFKKRKKKTLPVFHSSLSPYDEAMNALLELKQYDLNNAEQNKIYHVTLSDILRRYCSRKQSKNLMNKTTGDILIDLKEQWDDPDIISSVAASLRRADAVKFAKYIPLISESKISFEQVKEVLELIEKEQSQTKQ